MDNLAILSIHIIKELLKIIAYIGSLRLAIRMCIYFSNVPIDEKNCFCQATYFVKEIKEDCIVLIIQAGQINFK